MWASAILFLLRTNSAENMFSIMAICPIGTRERSVGMCHIIPPSNDIVLRTCLLYYFSCEGFTSFQYLNNLVICHYRWGLAISLLLLVYYSLLRINSCVVLNISSCSFEVGLFSTAIADFSKADTFLAIFF